MELMVNQWRSTGDVLKWFTDLTNKDELRFVQFDIVSFYPSIASKLLKKAIQLAREHTRVTEEEEEIIMGDRKTVLCDKLDKFGRRRMMHTLMYQWGPLIRGGKNIFLSVNLYFGFQNCLPNRVIFDQICL